MTASSVALMSSCRRRVLIHKFCSGVQRCSIRCDWTSAGKQTALYFSYFLEDSSGHRDEGQLDLDRLPTCPSAGRLPSCCAVPSFPGPLAVA